MDKGLARALLEVQKRVTNPAKNVQGFGYVYADLPQVLSILKPLWDASGLLVNQQVYYTGGAGNLPVIETSICHVESGEQKTFTIPLLVHDPDGQKCMQNLGSSITYARRYALVSLFGMVADEDTDGVQASQSKKVTKAAPTHPRSPTNGSSVVKGSGANSSKPLARTKYKGIWAEESNRDALVQYAKKVVPTEKKELVKLVKIMTDCASMEDAKDTIVTLTNKRPAPKAQTPAGQSTFDTFKGGSLV